MSATKFSAMISAAVSVVAPQNTIWFPTWKSAAIGAICAVAREGRLQAQHVGVVHGAVVADVDDHPRR